MNTQFTFSSNFVAGQNRELIIADGTAPEILELLKGAQVPYVALGACDNPLQAISTVLAGEQLERLHIVAHGLGGRWSFGGQWVDESTLANNATLVSDWQVESIALWVCEAARDLAMLDALARLTSAQVYATEVRLGWDAAAELRVWELKSEQGTDLQIAKQVFDPVALDGWNHQLISLKFEGVYATTNSGAPDGFYGEETSSVTIDTTALSTSNVIFRQVGEKFSGNNVLGFLSWDSTPEFTALASRPIKVNGVVKGFYVWVDKDGSGAGTSGDLAYILSLDNTYFGANSAINSSSDRVDSALNSVLPVNSAPVAVADASNLSLTPGTDGGPALEAGGVSNVTPGADANGDVLSNDTDTNAGDTKTVLKAGTSSADTLVTAATASPSDTDGTKIVGVYGDLYIGTDGNYRYQVDNTDSAVQALRTTSDTLSDTFTYQMKDAAGATSTTTLTVKIVGANDAPVAQNDTNIAKETQSVTGFSATGNVLFNDKDVEGYVEKLLIAGTIATTNAVSAASTASKIVLTTDPGNIVGKYALVLGNAGAKTNLVNSSGTELEVSSQSLNGLTITLNGVLSDASKSLLASNTSMVFSSDRGGNSGQVPATYSLGGNFEVVVNSIVGIKVGSVVSDAGSAIPNGTTVVAINEATKTLTLSNPVDLTSSTSLTFDTAVPNGSYVLLAGVHGSLQLFSDGSYVYTPLQNNSALLEGQSAVEVFEYTVIDLADAEDTATLSITVYGSGSNDPVLAPDVADSTPGQPGAALEAGTVGGSDATGNVLTNDNALQQPNGSSNVVIDIKTTGGTDGSIGNGLVGQYGTLTIDQLGNYRYVVDNTDNAVNALNSGDTLQESFVYTVKNGLKLSDGTTDAQSSATLTVVINGANDAPLAVNDKAIAVEAGGVNNSIPGVNPSGNVLGNDSDVDNAPSELTVSKVIAGAVTPNAFSGTVNSASGYGTLTIAANGTWSYSVNQNSAAVNALTTSSLPLTDIFTYVVSDGAGGSHTATLTIDIYGGTDIVAVNDVFVNEASPYAVFKVTGVAGIEVSLATGTSTPLLDSDKKATIATDTGDLDQVLEYYSSGANDGAGGWLAYTSAVAIPDGGVLLVRVGINQDNVYESNEAFTLNVTPTGGTVVYGIGTINDEGEGDVFLPSNNTGTPNLSTDFGYPTLDDDRGVTVTSPTVNEASPYAVFTVDGVLGQQVTLSLGTGSATSGTDYTASMEVSTDGGKTWTSYSSGTVALNGTNGTLLVRVPVINDSPAVDEGDETFTLTATPVGGTAVTGTTTIVNDGNGVIYTFDPTTGLGTSTTGLDDDRAITVSSPTVNEASPYAVFTVTGAVGQTISLVLGGGTASGAGTDYGSATATANLQYSLDGGSTWSNYSDTGAPTLTDTSMLVRTPVVEDSLQDNGETFTLTATPAGGTAVVGTATINDQGGGTIFNDNGTENTTAAKSDDSPSSPPPPPRPQPEPPFDADLDPQTDTGEKDRVTTNIEPEFTLNAGNRLTEGGSAQLLDPQGNVVGTTVITAADVASGNVNVAPGILDDGVYTFTAQILDANGNLVASAPVTVTVVTDLDGVAPSVELAANGGDFNSDGIADWLQNNVAQLPLASFDAFTSGKLATASSFGAIIAGNLNSDDPSAPVVLDGSAQLLDISIAQAPAPLPESTVQATPLFKFSVTSESNSQLVDVDTTREGLQTRVVIELQSGGVQANTFLKWNAAAGEWFDFLDDGDLSTFDDGATLIDTNGDGSVNRVVITLTDGGIGDADGLVNGVIVDPGLLAFQEPTSVGVYSVLLSNGDRFYTVNAAEAASKAQGTGNIFEGVRFDSLQNATQHDAYYNFLTGDWYFASEGQPMPYACYVHAPGAGFAVDAAGQGTGVDFHLFMNNRGITQLVTKQEAADLNLIDKGYTDRGALFNTTTDRAFVFDAEGYLVANKENASIQAFVNQLSTQFSNTSDARFIDAVELHYLNQVQLVGLPHGGSATAADLNLAFATQFGG